MCKTSEKMHMFLVNDKEKKYFFKGNFFFHKIEKYIFYFVSYGVMHVMLIGQSSFNPMSYRKIKLLNTI